MYRRPQYFVTVTFLCCRRSSFSASTSNIFYPLPFLLLPGRIQPKKLPVLLRLGSVCLRVVAITAKADKVIKSAFPALAAEYDMMNVTPVFAADYTAIPVSLNRLPLRSSKQFAVLLCVLVHVVNALSTLQPRRSL